MQTLNKLHLGCGDNHLDGFINCDVRETPATDKIFDCSELQPFEDNSVDTIYSHAFVEHIEAKKVQKHFDECARTLTPDGFLVITGLPDFETIADIYLKSLADGNGEYASFNLYDVYRLTHGDPENDEGLQIWQLHKCLFDKLYVRELLVNAGFKTFFIFNYCHGDEIDPVALGVIATKAEILSPETIKNELIKFDEVKSAVNKELTEL